MEDCYEKISGNGKPIRIAVISDTHIPDRVDRLHPFLIERLKEMNPDLIFHCGDISTSSVLTDLEQAAPVRAVIGNRDFALINELPISCLMEIYGSKVVVTHGHLSVKIYWKDKFSYIANGYDFQRYKNRFDRAFKDTRVIVFGHTHHPENRWIDGKLYFNSGSVSRGDRMNKDTCFGSLIFFEDGRIESSLIPLTGAVIKNKKWVIKS